MTDDTNPDRGQARSHPTRSKRLLALALLATATFAWAETPEEFAGRLKKAGDVDVSVNHREDGRLGSISIKIAPKVLADRERAGAAIEEVAKFAAASNLGANVIAPRKEDAAFMIEKLMAASVPVLNERVMAEGVSNKTARIFLVPPAPPK